MNSSLPTKRRPNHQPQSYRWLGTVAIGTVSIILFGVSVRVGYHADRTTLLSPRSR